MDRDDVPDEFLQLVRWMELLLLQEGQIFPEADFVAIDFVAVQPDAMLRQLRIVELRPVPIGVVIHSLAAEQERTGRDGDDWRGLSQRCDPGQMAGQFRRRFGPGHYILGAPQDEEEQERASSDPPGPLVRLSLVPHGMFLHSMFPIIHASFRLVHAEFYELTVLLTGGMLAP